MQILIITCWQGHISINWIGDGIQNCCNYCNFLANCRVGGEYFTSNKWKTVFRLKLVYSILDILFYISGAFCSQAGLCSPAVPWQKCSLVPFCHYSPAPEGYRGAVSIRRHHLRALGWGWRACWDFHFFVLVAMLPFCLFIDHAISPLPARKRLARSGPAGEVIFIWCPLFPCTNTACTLHVGGCVKSNLPV